MLPSSKNQSPDGCPSFPWGLIPSPLGTACWDFHSHRLFWEGLKISSTPSWALKPPAPRIGATHGPRGPRPAPSGCPIPTAVISMTTLPPAPTSSPALDPIVLMARGGRQRTKDGLNVRQTAALTVKFLTKRFISEYDPNLEDTYTSEELVDQQPVLLKVMDTADQDSPVNCERYLHWANAFLVVYSIDDRRSFEGCGRYLDILARHARGCQRQSPVLLLGNKLDMEQYRQVTKAEGMSLATKFGCLFYEVSACQDFAAVQHVFHQAVRELRREAERSPALRPLFIAEEQPCLAMATRHGLASCTINTLSTVNLKEIPSVAQAKLVTVKSSRAQSKRKAPTLTLLKGFKIF
uniref:small monomeric GTPase n=1 Tax=Gallus gallus TaxID=9031 RepID=A0A8V0Z2D8_CHICK